MEEIKAWDTMVAGECVVAAETLWCEPNVLGELISDAQRPWREVRNFVLRDEVSK